MPQKLQNKFIREIPTKFEKKDCLDFQENTKNPDTNNILIDRAGAALYLERVPGAANSDSNIWVCVGNTYDLFELNNST